MINLYFYTKSESFYCRKYYNWYECNCVFVWWFKHWWNLQRSADHHPILKFLYQFLVKVLKDAIKTGDRPPTLQRCNTESSFLFVNSGGDSQIFFCKFLQYFSHHKLFYKFPFKNIEWVIILLCAVGCLVPQTSCWLLIVNLHT